MNLISAAQDTAITIVILLVVLLFSAAAVFFALREQKKYKKDKFLMIDDVVGYETLSKMVNFRLQTVKKDLYFSLILLNIDHLDQILEYIGTRGSREFMENIIQNLHIIIPKGSKIARMNRLGELLIYLPELYEEDVLMEKAALFKETVEKKVKVMKSIPLQKSVSVTLVSYPSQGGDMSRLMRCLDSAMFSLKKAGGNGIVMYGSDTEIDGVYAEHYQTLRDAIYDDNIRLTFNPIFDFVKGRLSGCNAVFEWQLNGDRPVNYKDLMHYIEESGDELWVGDWSLQKAVMSNVNFFSSDGIKDYFIILPAGVKQLDNLETARLFQESLDKFAINPKSIVLDISGLENASNSSRLIKNMMQLQALGFKFLLDTEQSKDKSLFLLEDYKIDLIKINADAILKREKNVLQLLEFAELNNKKIIVDGIQSQEQIDELKNIKIAYLEGSHFGIDKTKEELLALL